MVIGVRCATKLFQSFKYILLFIYYLYRHNQVPESGCWFTGGVSSLHKHIARNWDTHGKIYLAKCKAGGITPNHFAILEGVDLEGGEIASNQGHTQTSLDGFVHPVVKWTKEGLLDHIIKFVVTEIR